MGITHVGMVIAHSIVIHDWRFELKFNPNFRALCLLSSLFHCQSAVSRCHTLINTSLINFCGKLSAHSLV